MDVLQQSSGGGGGVAALGILIVLVLLYFLPTLVAQRRSHHQAGAITVLNVLLGWTLIGWVAALVWAATATEQQQYERYERRRTRGP